MARANKEKKNQITRYLAICFSWAGWFFTTLCCVTYRPDAPGGQTAFYPGANNHAVGAIGNRIGLELLLAVGPGMFLALIMLGILLYFWTAKIEVADSPLRTIGGVLIVGVFSTLFFLFTQPDNYWTPGTGGALGYAIGGFLVDRFGNVGAFLTVFCTGILGGLLLADEFMLALPSRIIATWQRIPATAGFWAHLRDVVDSLSNRKMGRRRRTPVVAGSPTATAATPTAAPVAADSALSPADSTAALEAAEILPTAADTAISATPDAATRATATAEADPAPAPELVVRKPAPAKTPALPFRSAPTPTQKQDFGNYRLPGLDLLDEAEPLNPEGHEKRVREKARVLEAALESFGIEGKVASIETGPVVTLYELTLAPGVKSSQVAALAKDIARALMSPPVRIIDNIPGKSTMGVEVPNLDRERVRLKELMLLAQENIERMQLPMCLGKDASGNPLIEDLTKMPHLLIAGTTGSGKSVCINSIIMTILLTQRPDHVKLILVDPKMVEMQDYRSIPHLMAPIIDDMSKAESILEWATQKMDERYETMSEAGVRNIKDYNKMTRDQVVEAFGAKTEDDRNKLIYHLPYIVIIIDELADLMMTSKEVEGHIVRIAQKARAVGIHLILATQRPEAQVVTGLIKSNMPGRISFQVRSRLDSRIMLDQSGGELLLGQGDMLMLKPTGGGLIRGQGSFVDDQEIKRTCKFLKEIAEPEFHPELVQLGSPTGLAEGEEKDPLYNQAVETMIESGRGSVSLIQRRLNIGYSRASRLIDQMRRTGIVGAYKGSMASEVTVTMEEWEAMKAAEAAGASEPRSSANLPPGVTVDKPGTGASAGYAQQVNSTFDQDDDDGVPDEFPDEHKM